MKIGFALGGGGAKGFAHLGVLKTLEAEGIRADVVSGTSIGALVGAVYAAGNLHLLEQQALAISITDIPRLLSPAWSLSGFFSGKNALEVLSELLDVENIEELKIPFAASSVDLFTSERIVHTSGDLAQAIRSSISIPGIFTPAYYGERLLIDGGTLEPLPVAPARQLGADVVIAVDLFGNSCNMETDNSTEAESKAASSLQSALAYLRQLASKLPWSAAQSGVNGKPLPTIVEVIERTRGVVQRELTCLRLKEFEADVIIQPVTRGVGFLDFHRGAAVIDEGARAAKAALPRIREVLSERNDQPATR